MNNPGSYTLLLFHWCKALVSQAECAHTVKQQSQSLDIGAVGRMEKERIRILF